MDSSLPQTVRLDSKKIKKIREQRGLTQLYVATVVGVTIDTISRWENKRYPSVKRENAIKLAQTLEVDVEEILEEDISDERDENESQYSTLQEPQEENSDDSVQRVTKGRKKFFVSMAVIAIIFALTGLFTGYWVFRPSGLSLNINAIRNLPVHCAPGALFPVLIRIDITPMAKRTVLLKEDIPRTLKVIKATPKYTSLEKGLLKWIYQGETSNLKFVYVGKMPLPARENKRLRFRGTVTIKTDQTVSVGIGGNNCIAAAPFHWADKNGDNTIDDEEILDAYELLSGVKGMNKLLKEVENLWAVGMYQWDQKTNRFVPMKKSE